MCVEFNKKNIPSRVCAIQVTSLLEDGKLDTKPNAPAIYMHRRKASLLLVMDRVLALLDVTFFTFRLVCVCRLTNDGRLEVAAALLRTDGGGDGDSERNDSGHDTCKVR